VDGALLKRTTMIRCTALHSDPTWEVVHRLLPLETQKAPLRVKQKKTEKEKEKEEKKEKEKDREKQTSPKWLL